MAELTTTGCGDCFSPIIMDNVAAIRRDVAKTEADIKAFEAHEFCALNDAVKTEGSTSRLQMAAFERDIQNRVADARFEALKTAKDIEVRITDFERNADIQFRDVLLNQEKIAGSAKLEAERNTRIITDRLDAMERRSLKDELDETRLKLVEEKHHSAFALQSQEIASVKQLLNSVEQNQKFVSKVSQFGAGNVAVPTQTANQG